MVFRKKKFPWEKEDPLKKKEVIKQEQAPIQERISTPTPEPEKEPVKQPGTAAPGKDPNFRTTAQGDRFDINLPISRSVFSSEDSWRQANLIKQSGRGGVEQVGIEKQRKEESIQLQEKQTKELEQAEELISLQPQTEYMTRLAEAGIIPLAAANNFIREQVEKVTGKKFGRVSPKEFAKTTTGKLVGVPIGKLTTISIAGVSLSTIFSGYAKNIVNLQSDSRALARSSSEIIQDVLTRGGEVDLSVAALETIETGIKLRSADAMESLKKSPSDIEAGLDLADSIFRNLNMVIRRRHALERYAVTGDRTELELLIGSLTFGDEE